MARDVEVHRIMGEGSFGQVFEGTLSGARGERRVVLKRVKRRVDGAEEMGEMEHVLNVYATRVANGCVADFIGYCGVDGSEARGRLTEGLWLIWKYEGDQTLAHYLRRRDCTSALAMDLGVPEDTVASVVLKQILQCLQGLHAAGLVHRDVKPANLLLCDKTKQFKFIDLGACADLRSGTNYVPDESILDPHYCAPEQYVLPTDAPNLAKSPLAMAISPMLWAMHKPDRFDTYSAGLIFLQLCLPSLRTTSALKSFNTSYHRCNYDMTIWRRGASASHQSPALDVAGGAGWSLAEAMLRPRLIETDENGGVRFGDDKSAPRISVSEALRHRFFQQVAGAPQESRQRSFRALKGFVRKLFDLEDRILKQAVATERQTTTVMKLKEKVAEGKAQKGELQSAEQSLAKMESKLGELQQEFEDTSDKAFSMFGLVKSFGQSFGKLLSPTSDSRKGGKVQSGETLQTADSAGAGLLEDDASAAGIDSSPTTQAPASAEEESGIGAQDSKPDTANLVYAGLRFTGLAARIAADLGSALASSLKVESGKMIAELEKTAQAKKHRKKIELEYMEALRSMYPPVTGTTEWAVVQRQLGAQPCFLAVEAPRRETMFEAYKLALRKKEANARKAAEDALRALYEEIGIGAESTWAEAQQKVKLDERFLAVKEAEVRRSIFDEVVSKQRDAFAEQRMMEQREQEFRVLLKELRDPPISSSSIWSRVKRQIFTDPRYQAVAEPRRRQLFSEYHAIVVEVEAEEKAMREARQAEEEAKREAQREERDRAIAARAAEESGDEAGDEAMSRLQQLRQEQARLKEEYNKMAERLREMEKRLGEREVNTAESDERGAGSIGASMDASSHSTSGTNGNGNFP
ncbi:unnamed protein product [Ostreobium quekettii]|uniref:Protein kinase domain-containing protein n=1 Tax=Ostreobium quekettii TaxID=121088 RepID=A0A8S1J3W4_9CHLO|nr:unnamed protein product [Ostreobium quekettii]